jgi:hypothetical protein
MTRKRLEIIRKRMNFLSFVDISEIYPGNINPGTRVVIVVQVSYGKSAIN